jgi:uncharacterized protein (TIGR00255 family)
MRSKEGSSIAVQLERELAEIRRIAAEITKLAIGHPAETRRKLQERIESWNLGTKLAPERLEWELAFYADRADITEELDRIDSHTKSFLEWVQSKDAIGRKLDFLTQELHREVNTLGTKAGLLEITQRVIQLKNCIEKLREQVQNVE